MGCAGPAAVVRTTIGETGSGPPETSNPVMVLEKTCNCVGET